MTRYDPAGVWTADRLPDYSDAYRWVRPTLRVALAARPLAGLRRWYVVDVQAVGVVVMNALCRIGIHRWRRVAPLGAVGWHEKCARGCGEHRNRFGGNGS